MTLGALNSGQTRTFEQYYGAAVSYEALVPILAGVGVEIHVLIGGRMPPPKILGEE